mgnify:FL=1|jgi:predicted nucleic acid-binding protein
MAMPTLTTEPLLAVRAAPTVVVIDTNTALDFLVFADPAVTAIGAAVETGASRWLVCERMREELHRVLDYPLVAKRREARGLSVDHVMQRFDALTTRVVAAPKAPYTCKDPDDQVFIDLAVAHQATLYSKDHAVLAMRGRLAKLNTPVLKPAI